MTNDEQKNEIAAWKPQPFEGTDLLPIGLTEKIDTIGRDHVEAEDLILPAIKLLQGMSPEVTDQDDPEVRAGRLFHTGLRECFDAPVRMLLCAHTKSRALFPKDDNSDYRGIDKCVSRNGITGDRYGSCAVCPHKEWRGANGEKPPLCSESHNFTAITPYGPAILRFARTSFKAARMFITTWTMSPLPLWAHPVQITVKRDSKEVNKKAVTFFRLELKWLVREDVPPSAQAAARALHEQITAAHEQGRFGADDEDPEKGFDDEPL